MNLIYFIKFELGMDWI